MNTEIDQYFRKTKRSDNSGNPYQKKIILSGQENVPLPHVIKTCEVIPQSIAVQFPKINEEKENQDQNILEKTRSQFLESEEYAEDILNYLKVLERKRRPRTNYMAKQKDINSTMRSILIDWLFEVSTEFKLCSETVFLTVSLIDRFLSLMHVTRSKLQLVGVACMLIASKVEEMYPPQLKDFVYICDNTYTCPELRIMEFQILRELKFDTCIASPLTFCNLFSKIISADIRTAHLASYLCDLSLQEYHFLKYSPSEIAASAIVLALHTLELPHWNLLMEKYFGFNLNDLLSDCIPSLFTILKSSFEGNHRSIREKYSINYGGVSTIQPKPTIPAKQTSKG